jgi:hypothetical protein
MPINRKLLGAAAFSLALAGGGAAGALLGTPTLSLAQDGESEATTDAEGLDEPRFVHRAERLSVAAEAIGISEDDLRSALEDGQSIAQVAEANDVDVQTVVDALVADATEHLEDAIEALPERMAEVVEREGLPERPRHHRHLFGAGLDAAAEAIGIESEELRAALRDGSTIAEVAEANDVDVQAVIDALVADAEAAIDQRVEEGRLTEEEAADRKADLPERIEALVHGERPEGAPFPGHGPGEDADQEAEGISTAA